MVNLATRLIICVDGANYNASSPGETNIRRIYASIQRGTCTDTLSGEKFNQIITYIPGIGSADDLISKDRVQASLLGQGYLKQIQDVYESCSQLSQEKDEVWLLGFSRGAFVVRAVAGLLHTCGAVTSAGQPEFARDFKKVLKDMEALQSRSNVALSLTTPIISTTTRSAPKIQFVGVFETIKAIDDEIFDISFNRSICHMRQALALHEDRKSLTPETLSPEEFYGIALQDWGRTFVQAYFVGLHNDIGGSAKTYGLALYPCQWMLLEARRCGLAVDMVDQACGDHNPLSVVFPNLKKNERDEKLWSFTTENGIIVTMQDLREVHGTSRGHAKSYAVKLASPKLGPIRQRKSRDPFTTSGYLHGYCDWAPQGTIIHPSVYFLLDEHINISLETKELKLQRYIENWRDKMLGASDSSGVNEGFWPNSDDNDSSNPGAIRVLVCGNTGVGKSTLINKTFGVDITQSSHRTRGIHNVYEEITWEGRPDLIVHDSGGFEAGTDEEFRAIEAFLKEKSVTENILARVHVIWFCVDINSPRTLQTATEKLFLAVSKYAKDIPIVIIATKKDDLLDIEFGARRKMLKKEGKPFDEEECEQYAEGKLLERIEIIRGEMESVPGGRLDACLAVSQDDDESISNLSKTTSHCFDTDSVRLLYIRAQITRVDLKIDMAQAEIMKRYKRLIRRTGANWAPLGATVTRKLFIAQVTKSVINCFGLPTVSANVAMEALKANVWSTFGSDVQLALSELLNLFGLSCTGLAFGSPIWLLTGTLNTSHIVPTTCRLFLIMACDLTLVLARSFKEVTFRAYGQPNEKDVSNAARNYAVRGYSQHVHRDIKKLIPRKNLVASFKVKSVQQGIEDLFNEYKDKLMDNVDLPLKVQGLSIEGKLRDDTSTETDTTIFADAQEAYAALAELEANGPPPIPELDGTKPVIELPAESKAVELGDLKSMPSRAKVKGPTSFPKM